MTVDEWIEEALKSMPPLADEKRARIAELLRPARQTQPAEAQAMSMTPEER